jgi:cell division protein FtsL
MNFENEDRDVQAALKNFRASVHAWSEQEMGRPRQIKPMRMSGWMRLMAVPMLGWGLAGVLVVAGVTVPVTVHHERQVEATRRAAIQEQQRQAAEMAARLAQNAMNDSGDDEELLKHVDSDIAQATPDAMEPLASLMGDTTGQ